MDGKAYGDSKLSCKQPTHGDMTITISPIPDTANIAPPTLLTIPLETYSSLRKDVLDELYHYGYHDTNAWLKEMLDKGYLSNLLFRKSLSS